MEARVKISQFTQKLKTQLINFRWQSFASNIFGSESIAHHNIALFLFDNKIISKPTFYKGVKEGKFQLIKLGSKSFIDMEQFLQAFHKVKINNK